MGLILTVFILASMVTLKFFEGGWITLVITGALIGLAVLTRRHYAHTGRLLGRLDDLVVRAESYSENAAAKRKEDPPAPAFDREGKTAVLFVSGFNGTGLHTLLNVVRLFGEATKIARSVLERTPNAVFFGGQLIFPQDSIFLRLLHNQIVFAVQKRLYREGIPFVILPIRVDME